MNASGIGSSKFGAQSALARPFEVNLPNEAENAVQPSFLGTLKQSFAGFGKAISRPFKNLFTTAEGQRRKIEQEVAQGTYIGPSLERVRNPRAFYSATSFIK